MLFLAWSQNTCLRDDLRCFGGSGSLRGSRKSSPHAIFREASDQRVPTNFTIAKTSKEVFEQKLICVLLWTFFLNEGGRGGTMGPHPPLDPHMGRIMSTAKPELP